MTEKKPLSDARRRANDKWNQAHLKERYDRIQLVLPKGQKETLKNAADQAGESINGYVQGAILSRMGLTEWPSADNKSE